MSTETVNQMVERLAQAGPLTVERFAELLGAPLTLSDASSPYWQGYKFALAAGPFAGGELRLGTGGDSARLILEPRDPPGLIRADVDRAALGTWLGERNTLDPPPEGARIEYFQRDGLQVAAQWARPLGKLRTLALDWEPPGAGTGQAGA